ncbi:MAG: hypothetical protein ACJ749_08685, partial [Flavisolibacter sp.]
SKDNERFLSSTSDEGAYKAATRFMNSFIDQSAAYKLGLDVKAQESVVKDAEKRLEEIKQNEATLNKKMEQLKNDLSKNQAEEEAQLNAVENEKKKLASLKAKA